MVSFFHDIVGFLNKEEIPYMLTGSMAMGVYAISRSTQDFDFVLQLDSTDVPKLIARFTKGYYCNEDSINDAIRRRSMFNIIDYASGFKADFIILKANDYQQTAFARKAKVPLLDAETYVISGEDLILSKLMWIQQSESGRQKEDIMAVAQNSDLDWNYIRNWIAKLNLILSTCSSEYYRHTAIHKRPAIKNLAFQISGRTLIASIKKQ